MKKLLDGFQWNDKTKLLISAIATGAVLLFAILFPLSFRQSTAQQAPKAAGAEERTALFAAYWNAGDAAEALTVTKQEQPGKEREDLCKARMQGLIAACIVDEKLEDASPTGSEYVTVSDGQTQVNVCRMWMERSGDWKNWLDVCFDADTGEIYYLYLSCECLSRQENYTQFSSLNGEQIAAELASRQNGAIRYFGEEADGMQTVVISEADGTVCYQIACTAYDHLIDVKINCF